MLIYFVSSGAVLFGLLLIVFSLLSDNFASLVVKETLEKHSKEMAKSFYVDEAGIVRLDGSDISLKWGFDALYSNIGYRLVRQKDNRIVLTSSPEKTNGALLDRFDISLNLPTGHSRIEEENVDLYRLEVQLSTEKYFMDVVRSDLLGKLANEAVVPAIIQASTATVIAAFILFLIVNFIAIRLIVKPVTTLTKQIKSIKPEDLKKRIDVGNVPDELIPVSHSINEALERVEQGFELQKQFIADAAHELRTPLTIFLSRLELKMPPSEFKSKLLNDAHYISRIVEQLLDLSRAQIITAKPTSKIRLISVVKDICGLLAPLAIDYSQELELIVKDSPGFICADEGGISVIVKNLLENAIKHTPAGSKIKITVNSSIFTIEDSGTGIREDLLEKIFERFWRENQSDRNGSGLGLAITKELLDRYDALITVDNKSSLGGARFQVVFVRAQDETEEPAH